MFTIYIYDLPSAIDLIEDPDVVGDVAALRYEKFGSLGWNGTLSLSPSVARVKDPNSGAQIAINIDGTEFDNFDLKEGARHIAVYRESHLLAYCRLVPTVTKNLLRLKSALSREWARSTERLPYENGPGQMGYMLRSIFRLHATEGIRAALEQNVISAADYPALYEIAAHILDHGTVPTDKYTELWELGTRLVAETRLDPRFHAGLRLLKQSPPESSSIEELSRVAGRDSQAVSWALWAAMKSSFEGGVKQQYYLTDPYLYEYGFFNKRGIASPPLGDVVDLRLRNDYLAGRPEDAVIAASVAVNEQNIFSLREIAGYGLIQTEKIGPGIQQITITGYTTNISIPADINSRASRRCEERQTGTMTRSMNPGSYAPILVAA